MLPHQYILQGTAMPDGLMKSTSQFSISHLPSSKEKDSSGTESDHVLHDGWGSRLFGFVGTGATLGQLFGSLFAASMAWLGPFLLLFSAILMELAAQSSKGIILARQHGSAELSRTREDEHLEDTEETSALIQSSPKSPTVTAKSLLFVMLEGLWLIVSTYLIYISLFLWLSAVVSSFFYFQKVTTITVIVASLLSEEDCCFTAIFIFAGQLTLMLLV